MPASQLNKLKIDSLKARSYESPGSSNYHFLNDDHLAIELEHGELIMNHIQDNKPKIILEVGTGHGHSTAWMLMALGSYQGGQIYTYDTEIRKPYVWETLGLSVNGNLKIFGFDFQEATVPRKLDFVFHDSQHNYDHITTDLERIIPNVSKKGQIWIHDVKDDLNKRMEDYFYSKKGWSYSNDPRGCGMAFAIKGDTK